MLRGRDRGTIRAGEAAFKWAEEQKHIDRSPIRHVKVPAAVPRRPGRSLAGTSRLQASMDRLPGPPYRCLLNRAARTALGSAVGAAHQTPLSMDHRQGVLRIGHRQRHSNTSRLSLASSR